MRKSELFREMAVAVLAVTLSLYIAINVVVPLPPPAVQFPPPVITVDYASTTGYTCWANVQLTPYNLPKGENH